MNIQVWIGDCVGHPSNGISDCVRTRIISAIEVTVKGYREQFGHPEVSEPIVLDHCTVTIGEKNYDIGDLPVHQADREKVVSDLLCKIL